MDYKGLIKYFEDCPSALRQGAGYLAKRKNASIIDVYKARKFVQNKRKRSEKEFPKLKVLLLDIETAPMRAYIWKRWKENISLDQTISEWFMLCWSAKWLYADDVMGERLTSEEVLAEDDYRIVANLWKLLDEADIVVAHNGNRFDIPKINSRFVIHQLPPPSTYFKVDTCSVAKYSFGFSSNKLDALAGYFGFPQKMDTDFNLWKECMEGNEESLNYMLEYNKKDVEILEMVYLRLLPYIKGHPNISNLINKECCCKCGSEHLIELEDKFYYTTVSKFKLYRCPDCGAIVRGRVNLSIKRNIPYVNVAK